MTGRAVKSRPWVSVRLEGGLGDHILGMRVLRFIRERHPDRDIVIFSDAGGQTAQLEVCAMSPLASTVVSVLHSEPPRSIADFGQLERLRPQDLAHMLSADLFVDAYGELLFTTAAVDLDVPIFEILASRPALRVPTEACREAAEILAAHPGDSVFVAINFTKHGPRAPLRADSRLVTLLRRVLDDPRVRILNIFTSAYDFLHWPEPERTQRQQLALNDARFHREICALDPRIVPCADLAVSTVAALLQRCSYLFGVDNGIKHLAWALDLPHTFFLHQRPTLDNVLRWIPDLNRMLLFTASDADFDVHVRAATAALEAAATRPYDDAATPHSGAAQR